MAAINNNTLYPPIMDTYLPAIVKEDFENGKTAFNVDFTISNYTNIDEIKEIQIQIKSQDGLKNVLKDDSGIYFTSKTLKKNTERRYSIEIPKEYFLKDCFSIDEFYRIQVRFSKVEKGLQNSIQYLTENINDFSEWSTISLRKIIPSSMISFTKGNLGKNQKLSYITSLNEIEGYLNFLENTSEYLYNYRIRVFLNTDKLPTEDILLTEPIEDSGIILGNIYQKNFFNYTFKYDFDKENNYSIIFDYSTSNNYNSQNTYLIRLSEKEESSNLEKYIDKDNIKVFSDSERGCNKIIIPFKLNYNGNIIIRRTDGKTNYKVFEDIYRSPLIIESNENFIWEDHTAESGILYKYIIQDKDKNGNRSEKIILNHIPCLFELNDIFLNDKDNILKIKLNPNIDSYQLNTKDSIVETIGSKYPYLNRGAVVNYKSFSLSGSLGWDGDLFENKLDKHLDSYMESPAADWDEEKYEFKEKDIDFTNHLFANLTSLFSFEEIAREYREIKYRYNRHADYNIERLFRDLALEYLNNGKPKLYRSATEGNILVKLTDITLTPKQELGRLIFDFSATATEIDECTIENYNFYNIIYLLNEDFYLSSNKVSSILGQYQIDITQNEEEDIYSLIKAKYESIPYGGTLSQLKNLSYVMIDMSDLLPSNKNIIGKVAINGENDFYISKDNPYLEFGDIIINALKIETFEDGQVLINYKGDIVEDVDFSDNSKIIIKEKGVGQLKLVVKPGDSLVDILKEKYNYLIGEYEQFITSVNKVIIDTNGIEGACFLVQDSNLAITHYDDEPYPHIVDENGILELYDEEASILEVIYKGVDLNMIEHNYCGTLEKYYLDIDSSDKNGEPLQNGDIFNARDFIITEGNGQYYPEDRSLYHRDSDPAPTDNYAEGEWYFAHSKANNYIYLNNNWYILNENNTLEMPIEIIFTYFYDIERSQRV